MPVSCFYLVLPNNGAITLVHTYCVHFAFLFCEVNCLDVQLSVVICCKHDVRLISLHLNIFLTRTELAVQRSSGACDLEPVCGP